MSFAMDLLVIISPFRVFCEQCDLSAFSHVCSPYSIIICLTQISIWKEKVHAAISHRHSDQLCRSSWRDGAKTAQYGNQGGIKIDVCGSTVSSNRNYSA